MVPSKHQLAKKKATELLERCGITEPHVDVFHLANAVGLDVAYFQPSTPELRQVSGFLDCDDKVVFLNLNDPPKRQTFTIAHELGHYVLEHQADEYGVLQRFNGYDKPEPKEREANIFAANLLVPEKMLRATMKQFGLSKKDIAVLANIFAVSDEMMKIRLRTVFG